MIPCLAISLKRHEQRRKSLEAEMSRLQLDCVFIDAVDGETLEDPAVWSQLQREFPEYLDGELSNISLTHAQIGCYLSQLRALRYLVSHDCDHALIVEDDVHLDITSFSIIEELSQTDLHWDMIKLAHTGYPLVKGIRIAKRVVAHHRLDFYFYWRGIIGTTCNLHSRAGAIKLLRNLPRWGLSLPVDALIASHRYRMGYVPLFVRPELAKENPELDSSVVSGRSNRDAFEEYLRNQGFWSRKKRQLRNIATDLTRPLQSLVAFAGKINLPLYYWQFLLFGRKKRTLRQFTLLGSSVVSANTHLFRKLGVRIPWLDPLWVPVDIVVGALYWLLRPSQYRVFRWWLRLNRRRFEFRSFAAKPGELTVSAGFYLLRQAGYYGRWLRHMLILRPTGVVMWNGWRSHWARKALRPANLDRWYFENAPLPRCLTMDPQGVNAASYLPQNPDFYLAWAKRNPEPAIGWQSVAEEMSQRPVSAKHLTSDLALIDEMPKKFIFVPLQKQDDSQIYLHADWVNSVDNFIRIVYSCCGHLPEGWSVIVKTHPSDYDIEPDIVFQHRPDNVFNGANFDSIDLLKNCSGVVNINGSMGLQAFFYDKPSVVLGKSIYGFGDMALRCSTIEEVRNCFAGFDSLGFNRPLRECFMSFLLNHYYLQVPDDLPGHIVAETLKKADVDECTVEQVTRRLTHKWDPWAGLGQDPERWARLAHGESAASVPPSSPADAAQSARPSPPLATEPGPGQRQAIPSAGSAGAKAAPIQPAAASSPHKAPAAKSPARSSAKPPSKSSPAKPKTAAKSSSGPAAKPAPRTAGKPASKSLSRSAVKPASKPVAKSAAKPSKSAAKPSKSSKPAAKSALKSAKSKSTTKKSSKKSTQGSGKSSAKKSK